MVEYDWLIHTLLSRRHFEQFDLLIYRIQLNLHEFVLKMFIVDPLIGPSFSIALHCRMKGAYNGTGWETDQ